MLVVNGSECHFNCCTNEGQKKGWWRSSVLSHLTTAEKENTENEQILNKQQQNIHLRRPSEPTISNEQNIQKNNQTNNYSELNPNYLISPPKKKIGPKKTKSTFAILFPHNFHPHLPMSFSWNNNLSSASSPLNKSNKTKKMQPPPDPAPEYFDEYKQTVRATDEFGEFIQPKQQNGDLINLINNKEEQQTQWQRKNSKRKQSTSSGQK
uniref:Uncharacterized protein n=1 Tax=Meloidogyne hapla TaxID=6305 RepID=A0A1I8B0J8_MELHA